MDRVFVQRDYPKMQDFWFWLVKYILNNNKQLLRLVHTKLSYLRLFGQLQIWLSLTVDV